MSILDAIYDHLAADAGVSAIVGDRIYPHTAPSSAALPYIITQRTGNPHSHHLNGVTGLSSPSLQIGCWASSSPNVSALSEAVRNSLDGFSGSMGTPAVDVRRVRLEDEDDEIIIPSQGGEVSIFGTRMDFSIVHRESIPA